jgi:hypothetical protein
MLHPSSHTQSALVSVSPRTLKGDLGQAGRVADATLDDRDKILCDHCNRLRYTWETCWRLHGQPTRGRGGLHKWRNH